MFETDFGRCMHIVAFFFARCVSDSNLLLLCAIIGEGFLPNMTSCRNRFSRPLHITCSELNCGLNDLLWKRVVFLDDARHSLTHSALMKVGHVQPRLISDLLFDGDSGNRKKKTATVLFASSRPGRTTRLLSRAGLL
ncbi:hypothetical protein BT69DRAFT_11073 [Atractiella rhizophila]|nr:hypothetical protein BT69DRAFT_11073 [Atractiella rhizophila]